MKAEPLLKAASRPGPLSEGKRVFKTEMKLNWGTSFRVFGKPTTWQAPLIFNSSVLVVRQKGKPASPVVNASGFS